MSKALKDLQRSNGNPHYIIDLFRNNIFIIIIIVILSEFPLSIDLWFSSDKQQRQAALKLILDFNEDIEYMAFILSRQFHCIMLWLLKN